jgi:hypothetical protein
VGRPLHGPYSAEPVVSVIRFVLNGLEILSFDLEFHSALNMLYSSFNSVGIFQLLKSVHNTTIVYLQFLV